MKKYIKVLIIIAFYIGLILLDTEVYAETAKVNADDVRLRSKATTESEIVEVLKENSTVEIISKEDGWYKVKYNNDGIKYEGYIRQDLLDVNKETNSDTSNKTTENITENATESVVKEEISIQPNGNTNVSELQEYTTITIIDNVDLRILPLINSNIIGSVNANTQVNIGEIIGKWCYIEGASVRGWTLTSKVKQQEITSQNTETSKEDDLKEEKKLEQENNKIDTDNETKNINKTMYVNASVLNVRKEAKADAEVIDQLITNTKITVLEEIDGKWCKIELSGQTGYVASEYLSEKKVEITSRSSDEIRRIVKKEKQVALTETLEQENKEGNTENIKDTENIENINDSKSTEQNFNEQETENKEQADNKIPVEENKITGENVVEYAKTFIGKKYVYGGNGPDEFDCSGFTKYVYNHFGYTLYRTSDDQRKNGVAVNKSDLQAGDILCFKGHVGIYIGKNEKGEEIFIHAENSKTGVKISLLNQNYYKNNYICARRII